MGATPGCVSFHGCGRGWAADELGTARQLKALAAGGRAEPVEAALSNSGGHLASEARDMSEREGIADVLAAFADALAGGEVTAGRLEVLAVAARLLAVHRELVVEFRARESELLGHAANEGLDRFGKRCCRLAKPLIAASDAGADDQLQRQRARSTVKTFIDSNTGMWHLNAERGARCDRRSSPASRAGPAASARSADR